MQGIVNVDDETLRKNFNDLCADRTGLFACQDEFSTNMVDLDEDKRIILNRTINIEKKVLDYACERGSDSLLELRDNKIIFCFQKTNKEVEECLISYIKKYNTIYDVYNAVNANECQDFKEDGNGMKNCAVNGLASCSQFLSSVFNDIANIVLEEYLCI